jgi:uncharacterized membrane protein YphA (DoxX/SURF4 family)
MAALESVGALFVACGCLPRQVWLAIAACVSVFGLSSASPAFPQRNDPCAMTEYWRKYDRRNLACSHLLLG